MIRVWGTDINLDPVGTVLKILHNNTCNNWVQAGYFDDVIGFSLLPFQKKEDFCLPINDYEYVVSFFRLFLS